MADPFACGVVESCAWNERNSWGRRPSWRRESVERSVAGMVWLLGMEEEEVRLESQQG